MKPAAVAELGLLRTFHEAVIPATIDADIHDVTAVVNNVLSNLDKWAVSPQNSFLLIAESDGQLIGAILILNYWNLCSLFVHPDFQKMGVGKALLAEAITECRTHSKRAAIYLNANTEAIGFYRKQGFAVRNPADSLSASVPMQMLL